MSKRYALYALSIETGLSVLTDPWLYSENGYILEICIPPYISDLIQPVNLTIIDNQVNDTYESFYGVWEGEMLQH